MGSISHITEAELARDLAGLLDRVKAGEEIAVERGDEVLAVMKAPEATGDIKPRKLSEILKALREHEAVHGAGILDVAFAEEVATAHEIYNQPMDMSRWD